jgi:hypothetical protein
MEENNYNKIVQYYNLDINNPSKLDDAFKFPEHCFCLISSARRSGKSILIRNLLKTYLQQHNIDIIIVFTNTKFNKDYSSFLRKDCIFEYKECEKKLNMIIESQKKKLSKNIQCPNYIILLDDVDLDDQTNKSLLSSATMGRHVHLTVILSVQYPKGISNSKIRANCDILLYNELEENGLKAAYSIMHTPFEYKDFRHFSNYLLENTEYTFICYNKALKRKERIKLIKSQLYDEIKLCYKDKCEIKNIDNDLKK